MDDIVVMENQKPKLYRQIMIAMILWLALWLIVFASALSSAVSVWWTSDTFNHCFLVLPFAGYFIWQQRAGLLSESPRPSLLGSMAALACVLLVLVGRAAHIEVIQHIGVFALLPSVVLAVFGWKVVWQIWFPLLFMLFAIPIGEELVPTLQNVTADISLFFLQLINIPIFRDGLYIMVPNGSFVVAEACSGISFFIACIMIGTAYAYMNFISRFRAVLFVAFAVVLPIIANGIRVFGIIYIGHSSNMQYAVGADHLIYGGVFFAFVVILLLIVGHLMSDGHRVWHDKIETIDPTWYGYLSSYRGVIAFLPLLLAALMLALVSMQASTSTFTIESSNLAKVEVVTEDAALWAPQFTAADSYYLGKDFATDAVIYRAVYQVNQPGKELIYWSNRLYDIDAWTIKGEFSYTVEDVGEIAILNLVSTNRPARLLAYWYTVPGINTSNKYVAKLQQAFNALTLRPSGGALTAISLSYRGAVDDGLRSMHQLLEQRGRDWQNQLHFTSTE
jgi:exosortase A